MLKKLLLPVIVLLCAIFTLTGCQKKDVKIEETLPIISQKENPLPLNLLPMYWDMWIQKTEGQKATDEKFIKTREESFPMWKDLLFASYRISMWWDSAINDWEYDIAMKRYNQARLLDDRNPSIYNWFASVLEYRGQFEEAEKFAEIWRQAEEKLKKNSELWYVLWNMNFNPQTEEEKKIALNTLNEAASLVNIWQANYENIIAFVSTFKLWILCDLWKPNEVKNVVKLLTGKYDDLLKQYETCIKEL